MLFRSRKEGFYQAEVDRLFNAIVLPNFSSGLSVYGASDFDLDHSNTKFLKKMSYAILIMYLFNLKILVCSNSCFKIVKSCVK